MVMNDLSVNNFKFRTLNYVLLINRSVKVLEIKVPHILVLQILYRKKDGRIERPSLLTGKIR